jgi:glycosyltransferase involved in cell wall biosynthesis
VRLMFVYYLMGDAGSAQDLHNFARVAPGLGHEVVLYGPPGAHPSVPTSLHLSQADALIFIFEWTTALRFGDRIDLARLVGGFPRERRVVVDCDGNYNDAISARGDYNHREPAASRAWTDVCDSLSDKICQPTLHPLRPNVRPFFFHAYDPAWERPLDFSAKEYGMVYVGHSKFRWGPMRHVLEAVQQVRAKVGRLAIVGHGWDALPPWAGPMGIEDFYYTEPAFLERLGVEVVPPVRFEEVIPWMGRAVFNPVIYRPLFEHLRLVTCRTFETPAAGTIPLFGLDAGYVRELYGEPAGELVLPADRPGDKVLDLVERPEHYAGIVAGIRSRLAARHSYAVRLQQLTEIAAE